MRYLYPLLFFVLCINVSSAFGDFKYQAGDCISPTNETWSWHKGFAVVNGVFERLDERYANGDEAYLLHIVEGASLWTKSQGKEQGMYIVTEVDQNTQKVPDWMCEQYQSG